MDLLTIRAKHKRLFELLYNAQMDGKLMRLNDISDSLGKCSSNVCNDLTELETGKFIRKYQVNGHSEYGLGFFGEAIIEVDKYPMLSSFLIASIWQDIYNEWRVKS